jgi:hypothetical protein
MEADVFHEVIVQLVTTFLESAKIRRGLALPERTCARHLLNQRLLVNLHDLSAIPDV